MSTILDALKKSETERKLNSIPTLADMPTPEEHNNFRSTWLLVLVALLLGVLLATFANFVLRSQTTTKPMPQQVVLDNERIAPESTADEEITVNVVSWAEQPDQRFAIIDGKLVRENDFVRPGLKLEKIQVDSVILIERGRRVERRP